VWRALGRLVLLFVQFLVISSRCASIHLVILATVCVVTGFVFLDGVHGKAKHAQSSAE
jgi:hypothetical protein